MNAADKLLNRTDLGPFTWHGKDRDDQFATCFADMGLPAVLVGPMRLFTFAWQIGIGGLFLAALAWQGAVSAARVRASNAGGSPSRLAGAAVKCGRIFRQVVQDFAGARIRGRSRLGF